MDDLMAYIATLKPQQAARRRPRRVNDCGYYSLYLSDNYRPLSNLYMR